MLSCFEREKKGNDGNHHIILSSGHGGSKAKLETVSDEEFRDNATNSLFTVYDLIICEYKYRYFSLSFWGDLLYYRP